MQTFDSSPVTLLQISDLHLLPQSHDTLLGVNTEAYFKQVLQHAHQQQQFDLILVTGDIAQEPCQASYLRFYDTLRIYNTPTVCLPGNHDDWQLMQTILNQGLISCTRQLLIKNWQLIQLNSQIHNSNRGWLSDEELVFLTDSLRTYPHHHALIAVHHHCLPTQSAWLDTMVIGNNAQLFNQLTNFKQIKIIVHGHSHQVIDSTKNNIRILGAPSTCFQFEPNCVDFSLDTLAPGYRVITLYPDGQISTQIFRLPISVFGLDMNANGY